MRPSSESRSLDKRLAQCWPGAFDAKYGWAPVLVDLRRHHHALNQSSPTAPSRRRRSLLEYLLLEVLVIRAFELHSVQRVPLEYPQLMREMGFPPGSRDAPEGFIGFAGAQRKREPAGIRKIRHAMQNLRATGLIRLSGGLSSGRDPAVDITPLLERLATIVEREQPS